METERLTVKEIARLAGVSIGTVDRVLHDRGGVSADTKERVDEIIASLGYEPNILARQLSLNKTYVFRAVLPRADQDSGYWSLCLAGLRRAERDLAPYRAKLRVDEFDRYDRAAYCELLDDLVEDPGDGLLIAPVLPDELLPALSRLGDGRQGGPVPYAFFDGNLEGASPVVAIGQDAFRGGYLAGRLMSLLAEKGRPLVALSAHAGDAHIRRRIEGFRAFFRDAASGAAAAAASGSGSGAPAEVEAVECLDLEEAEARDAFLGALFRDRGCIAGILVANSSGHLVGDWLSRRGAKEGCAVLSWDMVSANVRALGDGGIDCVVSQRPAEQAREGLEGLFRAVVRGEASSGDAASYIAPPIPLEVYFKENIPAGIGPDGL
jgi:LacI family transcriptional regulator